jgi:hypothetical protein
MRNAEKDLERPHVRRIFIQTPVPLTIAKHICGTSKEANRLYGR